MSSDLFNFAVITIFAREVLEGGIIIGEYRTVILRSQWQNSEMTQKEALRAVTVSALAAAACALVVIAAVAIPLAVLSRDFNDKTSTIIEGLSKIVASFCILGLSLKMPTFFGLYYKKSQVLKSKNGGENELQDSLGDSASESLTRRSIRFNVSWNIWREVAEIGVFLLPNFLTGEDIKAIPLSAVVGSVVGGVVCVGIYQANKLMKSTVGLTIFTVGLLLILSTGLFSGGCHELELAFGSTPVVWEIDDDFWTVDRLPMTLFKPFGYSETRTVLEIATFWGWLFFSLVLHWRKYKLCRKRPVAEESLTQDSEESIPNPENTTPVVSCFDESSGGDSTSPSRGEEGQEKQLCEMEEARSPSVSNLQEE